MWLGVPEAAGASTLLCLSEPTHCFLLALHCSSFQSDLLAQSTHYSRRIETQPLLHPTLSSHLTGSRYSEAATGLSALCTLKGAAICPKKSRSVSRSLGQYPVYLHVAKAHKQEFREHSWSILAVMREHSSDNTRDRKAESGPEASCPHQLWRAGNTQDPRGLYTVLIGWKNKIWIFRQITFSIQNFRVKVKIFFACSNSHYLDDFWFR